jgi:hypothetical protein
LGIRSDTLISSPWIPPLWCRCRCSATQDSLREPDAGTAPGRSASRGFTECDVIDAEPGEIAIVPKGMALTIAREPGFRSGPPRSRPGRGTPPFPKGNDHDYARVPQPRHHGRWARIQSEMLKGHMEPFFKNPLNVIAVALDRTLTAALADHVGVPVPLTGLSKRNPAATACFTLRDCGFNVLRHSLLGFRMLSSADLGQIFLCGRACSTCRYLAGLANRYSDRGGARFPPLVDRLGR